MLLELKNIKKYFPVKKGFLGREKLMVKAVDGVSLFVTQGESLALVGESGCGKTTLARIILQLIKPDEGKIIFEGKDATRLKGQGFKNIRRNIQMVFQDPYSSLDPRFTVRAIMLEAMTLEKEKKKSEREQQIVSLLKAVQLPNNILDRYPHEFSGGERQRIAIARALVLHPKILILDEAVSSLDAYVQEEILRLLKDLQKQFGLMYIFITHNLKVVRKIAQRVAVMYKGKIVETALMSELFQNPMHPYTQDLLAAAVNYQSSEQEEFELNPQSSLVEVTPKHFVLKE